MEITKYIHSQVETTITVNLLDYFQAHRTWKTPKWSCWLEEVESRLKDQFDDAHEVCGTNPDGCMWFKFYDHPPDRFVTTIMEILEDATCN